MHDTPVQRPLPHRVVQVLVAVAVVAAVWALSDVVLILFLAILLACVLHGASDAVAKLTGIRSGYVLAVITILAALAGIGTVYWILPKFVRDAHDLWTHLGGDWAGLRKEFGLPPSDPARGGSGLGIFQGRLAAPLETVLGSSLSLIAGVIVTVVTAVYLAADPDLYVRGVLHLFPFPRRARVHQAMLSVGGTLQYWVLGQLIDMVVVGVLAGVGMFILGVPAPFALGVLSGLLTFVPYFGAILAAVPATLAALTIGWSTVLWALGVYTLCHCVEGYLIAPLVQRRLVDLPPALTVMSMTVAGTLFGLLGLALGTPLAAAGLVVVRMFYVQDVLGDGSVHAES